jgi:SAM-dependent methyltransferase
MEASYSRQYEALWRYHWWWRARHRLVLRKLGKLLPPRGAGETTASLLDIGCCGGVAFDDFSRFGEVYGLEPDPLLLDTVPRWRSHIEPVAFDRDYRSTRTHNVVLMLDVLEHIEDDTGAAKALARLVKPGGHVLLTVPALPSLWSVHDEANHHYRRYRASGLRRVLVDAGLEVVEVRYLFFWSLGLLYLRRWLGGRKRDHYQVQVPPAPVNYLFLGLTRLEQFLRAPLGSSLLAIARRPMVQPLVAAA